MINLYRRDTPTSTCAGQLARICPGTELVVLVIKYMYNPLADRPGASKWCSRGHRPRAHGRNSPFELQLELQPLSSRTPFIPCSLYILAMEWLANVAPSQNHIRYTTNNRSMNIGRAPPPSPFSLIIERGTCLHDAILLSVTTQHNTRGG